MRDDRWESSLEELCDSPEQMECLKKTASLLSHFRQPHCSSSFRRKLRRELLMRARGQAQSVRKRRGLLPLLTGISATGRAWSNYRPLGVAAALLIFVLAISLYSVFAPRSGVPEGAEVREGLLLGDAGDPPAETVDIMLPETPVPAPEEKDGEYGDAGADPPQEGAAAGEERTEQPPAATGTGEESPTPGERPVTVPVQPLPPAEKPDAPVFAVAQNRRIFTVAGNVLLHYGPATAERHPVDNVTFNWEPNKIVPASAPDAQRFGTQEWARQLLSDEGFRVREGETVEVKTQETTKGLYAEIFYRVTPTVILHVHADKGILAYYYEEKGNVAPQGYYPILTPLDALLQLQLLTGPIAGQQLHFSFREVRLTYHDFQVEQDGVQNNLRLPAWRFTGNELHQGKEGGNFFLPAVK